MSRKKMAQDISQDVLQEDVSGRLLRDVPRHLARRIETSWKFCTKGILKNLDKNLLQKLIIFFWFVKEFEKFFFQNSTSPSRESLKL